MIISEKQVMQLLNIAQGAKETFMLNGHQEAATAIACLMDEIANQQSEELKVIE